MEKINYRKLSNWALATDFYHTWREIFSYLKKNSNEFYIWHNFFNMNLELKCIEIEKYMTPSFETMGIISKDFDEHIRNIKFKRGKKKQKKNVYKNSPKIVIKHSHKQYLKYNFAKANIKHIDEIEIPRYEYNSNIDIFVNIFESLFERVNLKDKKKLYKGIKRWKNKQDKWSLVSFWKCINDMFKIDFVLSYNLDNKLKEYKPSNYYEGKLLIDTKEHYLMQDKCEKWAITKRKEEAEKKRVEQSNI